MLEGSGICRDEACPIVRVHRHKVPVWARRQAARRVQMTPAEKPPKRPWAKDDPEGLAESVIRATGELPTCASWIARDVRDDYGHCSDRTVYRYLRRFVEEAKIIKVDLGLHLAAYLRPKARLLADPGAIRDYMLSMVEITPCTKDSPAL